MKSKILFDNLRKIWNLLSRRTVILYIVSLLLVVVCVDWEEIKRKNRGLRLNDLRPSYGYLISLNEGKIQPDKEELNKYLDYYRLLAEFVENRADVFGAIGFCHYHLGDYKRSSFFFGEAIKSNPNFTWFHYNLGLIFFKNGKYEGAIKLFKNGLAVNPTDNLEFINSSKVYRKMLYGVPDVENKIKSRLKTAYALCYKLLILSYENLERIPEMLITAKEATNLESDSKDFFYFYGGVAAYKLNEYEVALSFFRKCAKENPTYPEAAKYIKLCLRALNIDESSITFLEKMEALSTGGDPPISDKSEFTAYVF